MNQTPRIDDNARTRTVRTDTAILFRTVTQQDRKGIEQSAPLAEKIDEFPRQCLDRLGVGEEDQNWLMTLRQNAIEEFAHGLCKFAIELVTSAGRIRSTRDRRFRDLACVVFDRE